MNRVSWRVTRIVVLALAVGVLAPVYSAQAAQMGFFRRARIPISEFSRMIQEFSEEGGYFPTDNLTSNELWFQHVIPELVGRTRPGGVYLGVGPEQNYTYIAAVKPALAIIFDIRRGNLLLQLMYKAIFEMAADRAEFVSMLFSRSRPSGIGARSTAAEVFSAFSVVPANQTLYAQNLAAIQDRLTKTHRFTLTPEDLGGITFVFRTFYGNGFAVRLSPTYNELMTEDDGAGVNRSYLASEERFRVIKALESKNLVIPIVGDFSGPKAIRAVGAYLKPYGVAVSAFYLSNVEQYLYQDNKWAAFCRNVATLPLDQSSTFIRSSSGGFGGGRGPRFVSSLGAISEEVKSCGTL